VGCTCVDFCPATFGEAFNEYYNKQAKNARREALLMRNPPLGVSTVVDDPYLIVYDGLHVERPVSP
jgi:hypothetical protein